MMLLDLLKAIECSSTPNPKIKLLEGIWDFKGMLSPQLKSMENHAKYLNFKIIPNKSGLAEIYYRHFCNEAWEP